VFVLSKGAFIQALHRNSLSEMQHIPKSDLHSHAGRGGSISYIEKWADVVVMDIYQKCGIVP
jgi:hypothetical protein